MMMRLWIDDTNAPPDNKWHWAKTSEAAIAVLDCNIGEISFGDLVSDSTYRVAKRIEQLARDGAIRPMVWHVHGGFGVAAVKGAMQTADLCWRAEKAAKHEHVRPLDALWSKFMSATKREA